MRIKISTFLYDHLIVPEASVEKTIISHFTLCHLFKIKDGWMDRRKEGMKEGRGMKKRQRYRQIQAVS